MQFLAIASGVKLISITPGTPTALDNAPGISSVTVQLSVSGGYAEIEQFDSALEGLQRTFLVSGFTFTGAASTRQRELFELVRFFERCASANAPVSITANFDRTRARPRD